MKKKRCNTSNGGSASIKQSAVAEQPQVLQQSAAAEQPQVLNKQNKPRTTTVLARRVRSLKEVQDEIRETAAASPIATGPREQSVPEANQSAVAEAAVSCVLHGLSVIQS